MGNQNQRSRGNEYGGSDGFHSSSDGGGGGGGGGDSVRSRRHSKQSGNVTPGKEKYRNKKMEVYRCPQKKYLIKVKKMCTKK